MNNNSSVRSRLATVSLMFRNKLLCLEHPNASGVNVEDEKQFRNLVLWLEEQKIRLYKIEDRAELRKVNTPEWTKAFEKYKVDLNCPKELKSDLDHLKWIVAYAIKLEYLDNADEYREMTATKATEADRNLSSAPSVKSVNPFDNLDCKFLISQSPKYIFVDEIYFSSYSSVSSPSFEAGVRALATKLSIPHHVDHLQVLLAISRVIKDNLNKEALKDSVLEGKPYPIFEGQGMNQENEDIEQAARILRLLQIQSIREMQTVINETIVETQNLTSDAPKTDTRLGKVGR